MEMIIVGTGSSGNCALIKDSSSYLMLDCGVPFNKVLQAIDYKVNDIQLCLLSHFHGDHILAINDVNRAFIPIYSSIEMQEKYRFCYVCPTGTFLPKTIGNWSFKGFELCHDESNMGFVIHNTESKQNICYICDTGYIKTAPQNIHVLVVECNYIESMIQTEELQDRYRRIHSTHLSLERLLSYLSKIDKSVMHKIILVHLSDRKDRKSVV